MPDIHPAAASIPLKTLGFHSSDMTMPSPPTASDSQKIAGLSSHDRILNAAKHLFATRGYENTSTVAIARAAGTSESQLIKHFGSKEGLLEAIFDMGWERMSAMFPALQPIASPAERLEALLEMMLSGLERDPELKQLMLLEGRRIRKEGHMVMLTEGLPRSLQDRRAPQDLPRRPRRLQQKTALAPSHRGADAEDSSLSVSPW